MIRLTTTFSNDLAHALRYELRRCRGKMVEKMEGKAPDRKDTATPGYVAVNKLIAELEAQLRDTRK